ncbi:MAG: histone deacetylase [Candidatus Electrothrix sp. AW1]|nr:histone deacetylase [Candidatus Electrothrix sp. AX1]MCI5181435.1 histone deacetylase [Candidatus Electrothrix gigas]
MRKTGVYRNDLFLEHQPGVGHPESPERLRVIYEALDKENVAEHFLFPSFDPVSQDILRLNHSARLVDQVSATQGQKYASLDADTHISARSYEAACLAAGALVDGVARVDQGELNNAFCLVRPPGHHAEQDRAMGFCLFNNVALAAHWAIQELGMQRILIFDWDLHHGNGTQNSFYDTDKVFYISSHQYPFYPGTGFFVETGDKVGAGYTVNIPLSGGEGDMEYARIVNELVLPVARTYKPELILISCGFDIYDGDPLGGMQVTPAGFAWMTRQMLSVAEEVCNGKLLVTLEGGYNLTAMRDGSLAVLAELCQENKEKLAWHYPMYLSDEQAAQFATSSVACPALDHAIQIATMSGWV